MQERRQKHQKYQIRIKPNPRHPRKKAHQQSSNHEQDRIGYLQPSCKSRKHRHKHEQQQEYCLHGLYASTTDHQPTNQIHPPPMSDTRTMVYYLPASEHKTLKSSTCPSAAARLLPHSKRKRLSQFYEFLTRHGVSYSARRPSISSPTGGALNVVL